MVHPRQFDPSLWTNTSAELRHLLQTNVHEGVLKWFDIFGDAILADEIETCERLVDEPLDLPSNVAALIDDHLRPGIVAWRKGAAPEAAKRLSARSPRAERRLEAAISGSSDKSPDEDVTRAAAYLLKGAWLDAAGMFGDAASAYLEAGKRFRWQGDPDQETANELLSRAIELDADLVQAYWQLADAWLMQSFTPNPPYAQREPLERSLAIWNAGAQRQLPDSSISWPYVTRALISEQQSRLDDDKRTSLWWEAIGYLERAVLLDESEVGRWAALGRLHRLLENESCALYVTAEAVERDPTDSSALEERAAILADTGTFDEAAKVIEQRLVLPGDNLWARGVKAYILAHRKQYQAALELIDQVIAAEPQNLWNLDLRAMCCWMLGERAQALRVYEQIWLTQGTSQNLGQDDRRTCAYAAFRLGKPREAIVLLEQSSGDRQRIGDLLRTRGLCEFVEGNIVRAEELMLSGLARAQAHELDAFLRMDLADLEAEPERWRRMPGAVAVFNRVKKTASVLLAGLSPPASEDLHAAALGELTAILQSLADDDRSWARVGATAGLARMLRDQQQWHDATRRYRELQRLGFPEAVFGIEQSVEGMRAQARSKSERREFLAAAAAFRDLLQMELELSRQDQLSTVHEELGDALWRAGDVGALEHFRQALALASAGETERRLASLHSRVALTLQQQGSTVAARDSYIEALRLFRQAESPEPGRALSDSCRILVRDVANVWTIEDAWKAFAEDESLSDDVRRDFGIAGESLLGYLDDLFGLSKHATAAVPVVTPISLEVGSAIVPAVDPKSDGGKFIFSDIPAMRGRIETSVGVLMPGISVREDPASTDRYAILLDEARTATGDVRLGLRYCLPDTSLSGDRALETIDPATRVQGQWRSASEADELTKRGGTALTETQFILYHVEQVLREHLDRFLGVQESESLVNALKKKGPLSAPVAEALANDTFRLFVARVLRELVREGVPITNWTNIVETVRHNGQARVEDAVRQVRLTMRHQLPGNLQGVERLEIPTEWESRLHHDDGPPILRVTPLDAHRLLVDVRQRLALQTGSAALVTPTPQLRSFVRRLIEYEFPTVAVLSRDEVVWPEPHVPADSPEPREVTGS